MPRPCKSTFDLLTLKVVSEPCVMWATSVPILVFLGLSVLDFARCTQQTDVRCASIAYCLSPMWAGHNRGVSDITVWIFHMRCMLVHYYTYKSITYIND